MNNARRNMHHAPRETQATEATLFLYGTIDEKTASEVVRAVERFQEDGVQLLKVHLNSGGGSVFSGYAIFNTLTHTEMRVETYIDGVAASIASLIAMAGETIFMAENAMLMIHLPSLCSCGNAQEKRREAQFLDRITEQMITVYATRTGKSLDEIRALMEAATWFTAEEALKAGFVHQLIRPSLKHNPTPPTDHGILSAFCPLHFQAEAWSNLYTEEVTNMQECVSPTQQVSCNTQNGDLNALRADFELQLSQRDQQIAELSSQLEEERRQRESLQQILAEKEARARVEAWIGQGKLLPAQREAAVCLLMLGGEVATAFERIVDQNIPQLPGESLKGNTLPANKQHLIQTYIHEWGMDEETATLAAENYLARSNGRQ